MKKILITTAAFFALTGGASAGDLHTLACSGMLITATQGYFGIKCVVPKGEQSYMVEIPQADRGWVKRVCGSPQAKGELGPFCRVQVLVLENSTDDDGLNAVKVLHVTNKTKFSWE